MKYGKKLLSSLLALILLLALALPAAADYPARTEAMDLSKDWTGKTILLHTNDVHGAISGYAVAANMKLKLEKAGAEVLLIDAGDFMQGDAAVNMSEGASAVELMNVAGYDLAIPGNHEFDYGVPQLLEDVKAAQFPVICANVFRGEELLFPADWTYTGKSGMKIGFFGLDTPESQTKAAPKLTVGLSFLADDALYACAQEEVQTLRTGGADLVIALTHLGVDVGSAPNRSEDVYANVTGIDFVIDGHSHTVMTAGENGEPIASTGTAFQNIGVIVIDNETKTIEDNFLMSTQGLTMNGLVAASAQAIIDVVDMEYGTPFAETQYFLNGARDPGNRTEQTNLGSLITDAMVWSVVSAGGLDLPVVGITNGGGIRASIEAGEITKNDINTVLPFGNTVAVIYVTGAELLEALEASSFCTPDAVGGFPQTCGIEWVLDTTAAYDQGDVYTLDGKESSYYAPASINRVSITSVNGEPFDEEAVYAVVTNNFCAAGGDTYNVFNRAYEEGNGFDTCIPMDEAVMDYITIALGGVIGEEYAEPSALATQIRP